MFNCCYYKVKHIVHEKKHYGTKTKKDDCNIYQKVAR
jgi:hypothetical protein